MYGQLFDEKGAIISFIQLTLILVGAKSVLVLKHHRPKTRCMESLR